jgi:hypothetical protein
MDGMGPGDEGWIPEGEDEFEEWREYAAGMAEEELQDEELHYYTPTRSEAQVEAFSTGFEGVYSVLEGKVNPVVATTAAMEERYAQEYQAGGTMTLDVVGLFQGELVPAGLEFGDVSDVPAYIKAPDFTKWGGTCLTPWWGARSIAYNTDLITEDPPETWDDLLDPRYKGGEQILVDFDAGVGNLSFVETLGVEYLEALGEQEPAFVASSFDLSRLVAQGDYSLSFGALSNHVFRFAGEGEPIGYSTNPDVWFFRNSNLGLALRPKHPWASKLILDRNCDPDNADLQTVRGGVVSCDGSVANPPELLELFDPANANNFDPAEQPMSVPEAQRIYNEALGGPSL